MENDYIILVDKISKRYNFWKITINGITVGQGTREQCVSLEKELKESKSKTKAMYKMFSPRT